MKVKWIHHFTLPQATQAIIFIHVIIQCLGLLVMLLEFAHFVELEEVVVLTGLEILRILVVVVAGVQTLLLSLELDAILLVGLLLLLAKQQVHGDLQLVNFVYRDFCFRCFRLRRFSIFTSWFKECCIASITEHQEVCFGAQMFVNSVGLFVLLRVR